MRTINQTLPVLFELARDQSDESRLCLAERLTDLFNDPDAALTLREEELVSELIDLLIRNTSPDLQARLIERLPPLDRLPHAVLVNFAHQPLPVAAPVLSSSAALTDEDLICVVEQEGREHALTIAARSEISEAVADALVTTGDIRIMKIVAENLGAHLSSKAIAVVTEAARYSAALRKPVLHRPEMNKETTLKLYWWVDQDLRRYALKRFGLTSGQIDQALAATVTSILEENRADKGNDTAMSQIVDWLEDQDALSPRIFLPILRLGHFRVFHMVLGRLLHLETSLVDLILAETGGRGLAALCRSLGIEKAAFISIFLLSHNGKPDEPLMNPRDLTHALASFDRMDTKTARQVVESWSANPRYFKPSEDTSPDEESLP